MKSKHRVSAFIRTFKGDIEWLKYCLRSLKERGRQFHEIVVAYPITDAEEFKGFDFMGATPVQVPQHHEKGYVGQQETKMCADLYCSGDFIMHIDSDCVAVREIKVDEFFKDGKPKMLFRPWDDAGSAICWKAPTQQILELDPPYETMASMPLIYDKRTYALFRAHVEAVKNEPFIHFIKRMFTMSEFNALGNFCLLKTPEQYEFIRAAGEPDGFPRPVKQFWSHGPIDIAAMEEIING